MKKLMSALTLTALLLVGCDELTKEEAEQQQFIPMSGERTLEEWVAVGETMKVEEVKEDKGYYHIMVEDSKKGLVWYPLPPRELTIQKSDKDYSYIRRVANETSKESFFGTSYSATYPIVVLYLKGEQ